MLSRLRFAQRISWRCSAFFSSHPCSHLFFLRSSLVSSLSFNCSLPVARILSCASLLHSHVRALFRVHSNWNAGDQISWSRQSRSELFATNQSCIDTSWSVHIYTEKYRANFASARVLKYDYRHCFVQPALFPCQLWFVHSVPSFPLCSMCISDCWQIASLCVKKNLYCQHDDTFAQAFILNGF